MLPLNVGENRPTRRGGRGQHHPLVLLRLLFLFSHLEGRLLLPPERDVMHAILYQRRRNLGLDLDLLLLELAGGRIGI